MSLPFVSSPEPPLLAELPIAPGGTVRVLDTVERGGPQLVEMDAMAAQVLNAQPGPVRALSVTTYELPEPMSCRTPMPSYRPPVAP